MKIIGIILILAFIALLTFGCVEQPICGNGICEIGENSINCDVDSGGDCPPTTNYHLICKNDLCMEIVGEGKDECSVDSECTFENDCGNGVCDINENETSCLEDCQNNATCMANQVLINGDCYQKIIEAVANYENPELYLHDFIPQQANDTTHVNYNYLPLIEKVNELTLNATSNDEKVRSISNWILNSKIYAQRGTVDCNSDLFKSDNVIEEMWDSCSGVCMDASELTVAMLNKAGVPSVKHVVFQDGVDHINTLYNNRGIWKVIDTTFFKSNFDELDYEINFDETVNSDIFHKNLIHMFVDSQGYVYDGNKGFYCDMDGLNCSSKPFIVRKVLISPEIESMDFYIPAMSNFGNNTFCKLELKPFNCFGYGCIFDENMPTGIDFPIWKFFNENSFETFSSGFSPENGINWLVRYVDEEKDTIIAPGYVHLRLPKITGLTYNYSCEKDFELIATASGQIDELKVVISWENLIKSDSATNEEYSSLITALKSQTEDLGIIP